MNANTSPTVLDRVCLWLATGLGVGFSPFAPGTVGAIWGVPLAVGLAHLPLAIRIVVIIVIFLIGIPMCTSAAKTIGRKDPGSVVWDEIATVPMTFFLVPLESMYSPWVLVAGFALHRVFDISKPPPARRLESLPDGWGIMVDDVVAGVYSCLSLHLLLYLAT